MPTLPAIGRSFPLVALLVTGATLRLGAQTAPSTPATAAASAPNSEAIVLSPFSVTTEKDYGYRSTMSATASGSGMAVKDTPLSISIVNEEFMADKNLTDLREVLRYVPGLTASTNKEERDIYARGFSPISKVDGLEIGGSVLSSSFISRVEIVKGPVSVLQGVASAGGVVNMITRRPSLTPRTTVELGAGDYGYRKGFVSTSAPLLDKKVSFLAEAAYIDSAAGWVDYTEKTDENYHFAVDVRPWDGFSLLADYQKADRHEVPHQHLTFAHPDFVAAELEAQRLYDARGLTRPADAVQIGELVSAWFARKGYPANTPTETINVNELVYGRGFRANIQGPDALRDVTSNRLFLEANLRLTDAIHLRGMFADTETDKHGVALSTFRPGGGWIIATGAQEQRVMDESTSYEGQAVAKFDFLGLKHRVLVGYQHYEQASGTRTITGAVNRASTLTGPERRILSEIRAANPAGLPAVMLTGGEVDSFYALEQVSAWDGRLIGLFGARYSESQQGVLSSSKTTPQYGATYAVTRWASVFAGYGESFRPNFVVDGRGNIVDPTEETNFEYGVKFETTDGKFSGTISVFDIEQKNVALRDFAAEAATGISPLYNVSGKAASAGAEFEFIYAPTRNYQIVASYARNWEARTLVAQDVRQQGVRLVGAAEKQFSFWNKYTFVDGALKGAYIGAGAQFMGAIRLHPSWSSPIDSPEAWMIDATLGYTFKLNRVATDVILRVNNLTDKFTYDQTFRPGMPRNFQVLTRFKF
jgi:iron complex outermembrane receptor protein